MTLIELGFKLLPYSRVENNKVEFVSWDLLSDGDKIITSIEIVLISIFLLTALKLLQSWFIDKKQINILLKILNKYKEKDIGLEYNNFVSDIKNSHKNLKSIWNEFDESLIKKKSEDNKFIIRNSIDSEYFFNKDTMINHVGSKLYSAIPGILLGIGLLGTFFGLYVALIQLNVNDAEQLSESIKILINMAGVKFAASIWGLGLSILFTFIDKGLEFNLDSKLERIQKQINEMFQRETAEQNLDKILIENEQQTKALNGLAISLTEKIAAEFNSILIPKIDSINEHFSNLPDNISSSISQSLEKPLQSISDTVKNITTNQSEQSTQALEILIQKFVEKIDNVAGGQGEVLKQSAIQSQKILEETSNYLNQTFKSMNEMMLDQNKISQDRDRKIFEDLQTIKDSQKEMLDNLVSNVSSNIEDMNQSVNENIEKLVTTISKVTEEQSSKSSNREELLISKISALVGGIENSTSKQLESESQRNEKISSMIDNLESSNQKVITDLTNSVSSQVESMNNNTQQLISKITGDFESHIRQTKDYLESIISNLKKEVNNIDDIFSKTSQKLSSVPTQIDKFTSSIDKLSNFENSQKETTEKLQEFSNKLNLTTENITVMIENLKNSVEAFNNVNSNFSGTILNTKELLSHMNDDFDNLSERNTEIVDKFSLNVDKSLNSFYKEIEGAIKGRIIPKLDNTLGEYAQVMSAAIIALSESIDELRDRK